VAAGGGAFEECLAHLRAAGVVQADEQDMARERTPSTVCGTTTSAASAGLRPG
jgi:hypothetical protein